MIYTGLEFAAVALTLCGVGYYLLCLWSVRSFRLVRPDSCRFAPPVSILKPLKGADRKIYESLRSQCLQDYAHYELIFGLSDPCDPAMEYVQRLRQEFPSQDIKIVICPDVLGANGKVSNLAQVLPHAKYDYVIVNDSDIRVPPSYLKQVMAHFADAKVGMVTCLYRGIAEKTLGSQLESIGISTDFCAGVLAARQLEGGIHFALGSTLAMRRSVLGEIGGFEAVVDYLADDFELGRRISEAGYQVILSDAIVDTLLPKYTFSRFLEHQIRWARSTRDSRKWGYAGLALTFGLPWAVLSVLLARGAAWSWGLLAVTVAVRYLLAYLVGNKLLDDSQLKRLAWLIPLRDFVALLVWIGSFAGNHIVWRGDVFRLHEGKLQRVHGAAIRRRPRPALVVQESRESEFLP